MNKYTTIDMENEDEYEKYLIVRSTTIFSTNTIDVEETLIDLMNLANKKC